VLHRVLHVQNPTRKRIEIGVTNLQGTTICRATTDGLHAQDGNSTAAFVGVFCTQSHQDKLSEGRLTDHALSALA
jgi:hypothetical protein